MKTATNAEAIAAAEAARDDGMELAARRKQWIIKRDRKQWIIKRDTLAFLDAMMSRPDRTATTDDSVDDLHVKYSDGGRWRGSIPNQLARQGLIRRIGVVPSCRVSRHRGYVALWQAIETAMIDFIRRNLRYWLDVNPEPVEPSLFDGQKTPDVLLTSSAH